ncbi:MAG TPA: hypothetical protein VJQ82_21695 [Terriglobales bacterium]|nr:hypothetical protein [Terriglobales bacterium]
MSILAAIFGWTKLPQWALELLVIAGLAGGFWMYHRHVYDTGIRAQQAADAKATAPLLKAADIQTQAWKNRATTAEAAHAKDQSELALYRAARPIVYRVCFDAHDSGIGMPEASALVAGAQSAPAAATLGEPVPAGNTVVSEDRGPLLDAFAALFDTQDDTLRELQARDGVLR